MNIKKLLLTTLLCLTGAPYISAAGAAKDLVLEEVVVTARKLEENIQSVPIPITAHSGTQLISRGVTNMSDLTRITPNLLVDTSGISKNNATIFLRGVGQANFGATQDPKVGVYVDEFYLGRPSGSIFDFFDVERVEVLRGPQGTLFGRNTTAGLVHVVNQKPQSDFEASLKGGLGNDGQRSFSGMVNLPVHQDLAVRLSMQSSSANGYVNNTATSKRWNDKDLTSIRASLLWTPTETFDALLSYEFQDGKTRPSLGQCEWTGPDNGAETASVGGLPYSAYIFGVYDEIRDTCNATDKFESSDNDPDRTKISVDGVYLTWNWQTDSVQLTSVTGWRQSRLANTSWGIGSDSIGTPSYLESIQTVPSDYEQWSQEFRLSGVSFNDKLEWVFGVYFFEEDSNEKSNLYFFRDVTAPSPEDWPFFSVPFPFSPRFDTFGDIALFTQGLSSSREVIVNNRSSAVFFEGNYALTDKFTVTMGMRYTEDDREFIRGQTRPDGGLQTPACPDGTPARSGIYCEVSEKFSKTTPRIILSYHARDNVMLYGSLSKGYSSGGFNNNVRMKAYAPETSDNVEIGLKSSWLGGRVISNFSSYYNAYKNQQLTVTRIVNGRPAGEILNAQNVKLYGIEGELQALLGNGWELSASFGWVDGEYDKFIVEDVLVGPAPDFNPIIEERDLSDTEALMNSPYNYSVSLNYETATRQGGKVEGHVGWSFRGRQYNTLENLTVSKQSGFGLLDARLVWSLPNNRTTFAIWGKNLMDKKYFLDALDLSGGAQPLFTVTKYWGEPQRFGLEIEHRFGG